LPLPDDPIPVPAKKMQLPPIPLTRVAGIFEIFGALDDPIDSVYPLTFEELKLRHGFVSYSTNIAVTPSDPAVLNISKLHDRGLVFVDHVCKTFL